MSTPTGAEVDPEAERPNRRTAKVSEVKRLSQPPGLKERRNEEHWAGRLYMRDVSPYFTWLFLRLGFSANQLTYLMLLSGIAGGVVAGLWSGLYGAIAAPGRGR